MESQSVGPIPTKEYTKPAGPIILQNYANYKGIKHVTHTKSFGREKLS